MTAPLRTGDGRFLHTFHQSDLEQFSHCLERGRRSFYKLLPRTETDAAAIGTSVHEAIEYAVQENQEYGTWPALGDLEHIATAKFEELTELPNFGWKKYSEAAATTFIGRAVRAFHTEVMPTLEPMVTEHFFGPIAIVSDDKRVIEIEGTIDYVDRSGGLLDWKTASDPYKAWEKQRWAIQPTVYSFAAAHDGLVPAEPPVDFTYKIFLKNGTVQTVVVTRHGGDWDWMRIKCIGIAELLETELAMFPVNDTHALCSTKWCAAFADCKGATREALDAY